MKSTKLIICLLLMSATLFSLSSCSKSDVTFDFPITVQTGSFGPYIANSSTSLSETVAFKLDSLVSANGGSLDRVKKIEFKNAVVSSTGASQNFNGWNTVSLFLKNGATEVKIAYKTPVTQGVKDVTLDKSSFDDVTSYFKASSFDVLLTGYNDQAVPANSATVTATFTVTLSGK